MPSFCCLLLTKAAKTTLAATSMMMIDTSALISGVTPSLTFEKINTGKVVAPGPDTKLAITTSSNESVRASSQPEIIAVFMEFSHRIASIGYWSHLQSAVEGKRPKSQMKHNTKPPLRNGLQ